MRYEEKFKKGETVIQEGDESEFMYMLVDGELKIYTARPNGELFFHNTVSPGESVGELAFFDRQLRSATVIANKDSTLLKIPREVFNDELTNVSLWMKTTILGLVQRLRRETKRTTRQKNTIDILENEKKELLKASGRLKRSA